MSHHRQAKAKAKCSGEEFNSAVDFFFSKNQLKLTISKLFRFCIARSKRKSVLKMGVKHLPTYLGLNGKRPNLDYFERFELRNSILIVDGGIATSICERVNGDPRFGSDYYLIYQRTYDYFKYFKECGIKSVILMDGIYEQEKENTMKDRLKGKLEDLRKYNESNYTYIRKWSIHPLLKTYAFLDAIKDLEIKCFRCDFEADPELIELARKFECPILSKDSDFALCNGVTFIPFQFPLYFKDSPYKCIDCFRFNREKFLRKHSLHDPSLLPLLAVIFESDYWKYNTFEAIFGSKVDPNIFTRIPMAMDWLRNKTIESAKEEIISNLIAGEDLNPEVLSKDFDFTLDSYNKSYTTLGSTIKRDTFFRYHLLSLGHDFNPAEVDMAQKYGVPTKLMDWVRECRIFSTTLDLFTLNKFFCRSNAMENVDLESIYEPSVHLLKGLYGLLIRDSDNRRQLELTLRTIGATGFQTIRVDALSFPRGNLSYDQKNQILREISCFKKDDVLRNFDNDWHIFVRALLYIDFKYDDYFSQNHVHAILLTAFILQIVKRSKNFNPEIEDNLDFIIPSRYIKCIDKRICERIAVKAKLLQIFSKSGKYTHPLEEISHIHLYLAFQVSLNFIIQVFTLLEFPDDIRVGDFVAGSFYHNIFLGLVSALNWRDYVQSFSDDPEFFESYSKIVEALQRCLPLND